MCRFEEHIYINKDGQRERSEESFPCDKATGGKLCTDVQRRTREYILRNKAEQTTISRTSRRTTSGTYPVHASSAVLAHPRTKPSIIIESGGGDKTPYVHIIHRSSRRSRSDTTLPHVVAETHRLSDQAYNEVCDNNSLDLATPTGYPSRPAAPNPPRPAIDWWSKGSDTKSSPVSSEDDAAVMHSDIYSSILKSRSEEILDSQQPKKADSPSWTPFGLRLPWSRSGTDSSKIHSPPSQSQKNDKTENGAPQHRKSRPSYTGAVSEPIMRSANETPGAGPHAPSPSNSRFGTQMQSVDQEKARVALTWLEYYSKAVSRVRKIRSANTSSQNPVKIAILDSGLELTDEQRDDYDLSGTHATRYKDWVHSGRSVPTDADGHGTHLTVLLRQIAPDAVIHVAKVYEKDPGAEDGSQDRIAQAITYAVDEWDVDIIVMAFGFSERHTAIDKAIRYASYKGRLMFAAASNDGRNRSDDIAWPARDANVICIHSGDGNGTRSPFTPTSQDNMRIMVLGESVQSACPTHVDSSGLRYMSGTSCAAPIAAGIAALILDYARGFLDDEQWQTLRRTDAMRNMFKRMRDENHADYWWIKPWKIFREDRTKEWIEGEIRAAL